MILYELPILATGILVRSDKEWVCIYIPLVSICPGTAARAPVATNPKTTTAPENEEAVDQLTGYSTLRISRRQHATDSLQRIVGISVSTPVSFPAALQQGAFLDLFHFTFTKLFLFPSVTFLELVVRVYLDLQNRCWRTTDVCAVEYIHTLRQTRRPECDVDCDLKTC